MLARFFITLSGVAEKSGVAAKDYVKRLEADVGANSPWTGYYPGKIYRDCGNGSYDIDFGSIDDGVSDIESVKAELIRVVGGAASSAEGSVVLAVGSAVEAKRGKDARDGAVAGANESTCNEKDHEKDYTDAKEKARGSALQQELKILRPETERATAFLKLLISPQTTLREVRVPPHSAFALTTTNEQTNERTNGRTNK